MVEGGLPKGIHEKVGAALDIWGIQRFYPPQKESLQAIADGENLVAAVPTAAGKSLIAYIAVLNKVFRRGKALYVVPLRALASEKFEELSMLKDLGVRVALSYGDYDEEDARLESYDIVVATSEKADSLLRHRSKWLRGLSIIVADEVHLLNDPGRGPTLEVILTRFMQLNEKAQLVCLSATIANASELANWLGAKLLLSDFRPVPLREGVVLESSVTFSDMSRREFEPVTDAPLMNAVIDGIKSDGRTPGQVLVFVNTRRSAESSAQEMAKLLPSRLTDGELRSLKDIADRLDRSESRMLKGLGRAIRGGAAFHHAGLSNDQRKLVERGFKDRTIKVLFATPTLAAGINLPARRVIVRDWTRFESWNPRAPIPVLEIKQMMGRAGRPRYDDTGEALILAKKEEEASFLMDRYILGSPEEVLSKLGTRPALRTHLLSSFATNYVRDKDEMWKFIKATFYAFQNDTWKISNDVEEVLEFLEEEGFIRTGEASIEATDLGKRVARLYIDPLSAVVMRNAIISEKGRPTPFSLLQVICDTPDLPPLFIRGKDHDAVTELVASREDELLLPVPEEPAEYEWFMSSVKTAMFFMEWIGENDLGLEASEDRIEGLFNLGPGDIRSKVETAVWLLYSMRELSRLFGSRMAKDIDRLSLRVDMGIREELIPLVSIKGVGRIRGRRLFDSGFRTPDDIRKATVSQLSSVEGIGRTLALQIQNEIVGGSGEPQEKEEEEGPQQSSLSDFP